MLPPETAEERTRNAAQRDRARKWLRPIEPPAEAVETAVAIMGRTFTEWGVAVSPAALGLLAKVQVTNVECGKIPTTLEEEEGRRAAVLTAHRELARYIEKLEAARAAWIEGRPPFFGE
jgi:hypothetical protein